jgi:eukaryotic-like serine/threonine-protein kinase
MPPTPIDPVFVEFQLALAGRYSIDRELGRGGMGIVYLAREVHLDRLVAIKLLPPEQAFDDDRRARFLREARLAARLSHPNIIPIFSVDEAEGFVYYVMAYVEGETLGERVRARGPLPGHEATRVLREVAWALGHAHSHGVIHRDVKPENILLEAATGRALVADFGIAAADGADAAENLAGTPEFMSPEQALGRELDARSDLYALGATAYYVCSGRLPFSGERAVEVLAKHVTEPVPPLASLGIAVPRRLAQVVERCLAKDPAQRPANAEGVAEQLGLALEVRREVPPALRGFVKRDARVAGAGVLLGGYLVFTGSFGVALAGSPAAALGVFTLGVLGAPFGYLVWGARRVVKHGFTHRDLDPAFRAEIQMAAEEFEAQHGKGYPRLERGLGMAALGSVGVFAVSGLGAAFVAPAPLAAVLGPVANVAFFAGALSYAGFNVLRSRRPQWTIERWRKFWTGRIGKAAFAVAARLTGKRAAPATVTNRATELSLGLAAEQLYEGLPKESRRALGDVPTVLQRLQRDAQTLKERLALLQDALNDAGDGADSAAYADIRTARDETAARVRSVVGTLETMRLNLLRLHAGSMTVQGLTTQFGAAADIAAEVERMIEAQGEVERALREPRGAADPAPLRLGEAAPDARG